MTTARQPRFATLVRPLRSVARTLSNCLDRRNIQRTYRAKYGADFVFTIDPRDEMYRFVHDHTAHPLRSYFASGEAMLSTLDDVLMETGRRYANVHSFLEFASGYGRFTRHLIQRMERSKITVADIDTGAVDFARQTFQVRGIYSVSTAETLTCYERYDVIFVASLFSHLSLTFWEPWLQRLYSLLLPGGLLIFSTHGAYALTQLGSGIKKSLEEPAPGFLFTKSNETHGRLSTEYYGTAYVSEEYVRSTVSSRRLGEVVGFRPTELWKFQDIYVVERR